MGEVVRWDPLKELDDMERRLLTWFGRPLRRRKGEQEALTVAEWSPLVDIEESEKEYLVKAELPGVKKGDVKLSIQDDVLTISGERKFEKEKEGERKKHHRLEGCYGTFMRSFTLPEDAEGTKVSAEYKNGMLRIHLPKSEKAKSKAIEVKAA